MKQALNGNINLSNIFHENPPNEEPSQFSFAVEAIHCEGGTLNYFNSQQNLDVTIEGISIDVAGPLNTWKHTGTFKIKSGRLAFNGAETEIDNFDANFQILASGSKLDKLLLEFGNSNLRVMGEFNHAKNPISWHTQLNLALDVADIQRFFGENIACEGVVNATLGIEGTDSNVSGTLSVEVPTFMGSPYTLNAENSKQITLAALHADANFNLDATPTFTLKTFSVQVADGTLVGDGSITFENTPESTLLTQLQQLTNHPFNYQGKWSATEVQLIPFLSMFVQLPENLSDSTGLLSGTAKFNGNSTNLSSLEFNSQLGLTETLLDEVKLEDSTFNCAIAAGKLKVNGTLDETEINITGPFPLAQQDILDIRAANINFDDLMKIANSANLGGTAELSAEISNGILKGFMEIPNATFNDIPIGVLAGNFRYQEGRVFIENGLMTKNTKNDTLTEYESRTRINGTVEIKDEFPAAFNVVAEPVYVQHYPKLLLGAEYPVDGEIRGELKLDGTLINLDGRANFSVSKGVAWGIQLDTLTLPLEIEDYNLTVPNFKISTRGQQATLNVSVTSSADYDFLLESDAPVRFEEIAKAAALPNFPFEGQFDVRVVGTLRKPTSADFWVELDFSDVTFLHNRRGTKHPLGNVYLLGKLVDQKASGDNPQLAIDNHFSDPYFDFHGHGFDETSQIRGYVSMTTDNPYYFIAKGKQFDVTPILPILHPAFEMVTGIANGHASISGTIAELAAPTEFQKQRIYPYDVNILVRNCELKSGLIVQDSALTEDRKVKSENYSPIRLHLKEDKWTIDALSLRTVEAKSPFIELTGIF